MPILAKSLKKIIIYFTCFLLTFQPMISNAGGLVVDGNAPISQRPVLDSAQNGVPVVNITSPSAGGVSRNSFSDFNVDSRGVIINNSLVVGTSQLGGVLAGNSNFTSGQTARIILNEVTGTGRSLINGVTEIFGDRAEYVLANPNGITCNGCGLINTPHVTLSTGTADVAGGILRGFNISSGDITFTGQDVNVTNLDAFDIISRTASFAASVYAGRELNVITGNNYVDYSSKAITAASGASPAPQVAIDSSALGGMYAGKINLVATERGVGVNTQGSLGASTSDISITADGHIEFKNANANNDIKITSAHSGVKHSGNSYAAGKTEITAAQAIELADGFTAAKGDVKINSATLDENSAASVMAGVDAMISGADVTFTDNGIGNLVISASVSNAGFMSGSSITANADSFNNTGLVQSAGDITITAGSIANLNNYTTDINGNINNTGGAISGDNITLTTTGNVTNNSLVQGSGNVTITAANIINYDSRIVVNGDLVSGIIAGGNAILTTTAGYISNFRGAITASGIFTITAINLLNNNGYISAFGDDASSITLSGALNNHSGSILTQDDSTISSASADNQAGGVISSQNNLTVTIAGELKNTNGNLYAGGIFTGTNINNNGGTIQGVLGVTLDNSSGSFDNTGGNIRATGHGATISIGRNSQLVNFINLAGNVQAQSNIDLVIANNYSIDGNITTSNHVDISAWSIINNAIVNATNYISLIATQGDITNSLNAKLLSNTAVTLNASGNINNYGEISGHAISITTANLNNYINSIISSSSTLGITATGSINNQGRISASDVVTINAATLYNTGGQIAGDSSVTITTTGNSIHNTAGGLLYATGDLILHSADIENSNADIYSLNGNIRMELATGTKNTSITNTSGTIEALVGDIIINTNDFTNTKPTTGDSGISVAIPPSITNSDGSITYTYDTTWLNAHKDEYYYNGNYGGGYNAWIFRIHGNSSGAVDDASSFLTAGRDIIINTDTFTNIQSQLAANRNVTITATSDVNNDAHTYQEWMHYYDANGGHWYNSFQEPSLVNEVTHETIQGSLWFATTALQTEIISSTIHAGNNLSINGSNVNNSGTYTSGHTPNEGTRNSSGASVSISGLSVDNTQLQTQSSLPYQANSSSPSVDTSRFVTLPTGSSGLFRENTAPGANYLIETNVAFIDQSRFLGSDYFLSRIGYTVPSNQKLLGDAFYETRLINQAVFARTGQRYLEQGVGTDFAQMQTLFDHAVTEKTALNLSVGIALSTTQIAALTSDIIWLENEIVDGQQVLVPVLYLAQITRDNLKDDGAIMDAGNNLTLLAANNVTNNGAIKSGNDISITAGSDITNNGGSIKAGRNITLVATNGDIINTATINRSRNSPEGTFIREYLASAGTINAGGNLSATAGNDVTMLASIATAAGSVDINAGNDITINTTSLHNKTESTNKHSYNLDDITTNTASNITAGSSFTANAGNDIAVLGSIVTSVGNASLNAGKDVNIVAVANTDEHDLQTSKSGFMSSSTYSKQQSDTVYQKAEVNSGGALAVTSGNNINLVGAKIDAVSNINLNAGSDVNIASVTDIHELHEKTTKTGVSPVSVVIAAVAVAGAVFTGGSSLALLAAATTADAAKGTKSISTHYSVQTTQVGSDVLAGADLTSVSNGDTTLIASALQAGGGINITSSGSTSILSSNNTDYVADASTGKSLLWQSQHGQGHNDSTVVQSTMEAGNGVNINATGGVNVDIKGTGNVQQNIAALAQQPGLEYLANLQNNPNVKFNQVNDAAKNWDYKSQGLTPEGAAILTIVVAMASAGSGAQLAGLSTAGTTTTSAGAGAAIGSGAGAAVGAGAATAAGAGSVAAGGLTVAGASAAAANAAFSSMVATAAVSLANNQGNIGKTLKDLGSSDTVKSVIFAAVTAGVTGGVDPSAGIGTQTLQVAENAAVRSVAQTAVYGENLGDAFVDNLKNGAIYAVGANAAGAIGGAYKAGDINKGTQLIAHAALSCGIGAGTSGNCGAGAIGGVAGELAAEKYLSEKLQNGIKPSDIPQIEAMGTNFGQLAGALTAAIVGADANGIYTAAGTATNSARNNALDTLVDALQVLYDAGKIGYGKYTNDQGMVEEGYYDLTADVAATAIPFVPAGSTKVARMLGKEVKVVGKIGPKINDNSILDNFTDGKYVNRQADGNEVFYKYHGVDNKTGREVTYVTNRKYSSESELRQELSIREDWGINIDRMTTFKPQQGTWISEGTAASKGVGYSGGGYQAIIGTKELPNSTIINTQKLPSSFKP